MKHTRHALLLSAAASVGLLMATAYAQQPTPPAPQTQTAPAQPAPDAHRGMHGFSADDHAAFFDARLAAVRAGLRLTPEQESLWPPVESAVRDMVRQRSEMQAQRGTMTPAADPVERMARMGEAATKRGAAMTRLAEAARPLYATLSDEQKRRLRVLMRAGGDHGQHGMMGGGYGHGREGHGRHHDHHMRSEGHGYGHHRQHGRDGGYGGGEYRGGGSRHEHHDYRGDYRGDRRGWNDWR